MIEHVRTSIKYKGGKKMDVYTRITELARERGVSLAKIERDVDLGNGTIGKWREVSPKLETVAKVAEYFGVTIDDLVTV